MNETSDPKRDAVAAELDVIANALDQAEADAGAGRPVALEDLSEGVDMACTKLLELEPSDARALGERLPEMVEALDRLGAAVKLGLQRATDADSANRRQRATAAYGAPRRGRSPQ